MTNTNYPAAGHSREIVLTDPENGEPRYAIVLDHDNHGRYIAWTDASFAVIKNADHPNDISRALAEAITPIDCSDINPLDAAVILASFADDAPELDERVYASLGESF